MTWGIRKAPASATVGIVLSHAKKKTVYEACQTMPKYTSKGKKNRQKAAFPHPSTAWIRDLLMLAAHVRVSYSECLRQFSCFPTFPCNTLGSWPPDRAFTAADTLEGMLWSEYCHQFASRHLRITLSFWWIHVSISQLCLDQWWSVFEGLPKCWNCGCSMFNTVRQALPMHLNDWDLTSTYEARSVMLWV